MASRRFFAYPYDYNYTTPQHRYPYPYDDYYHHPAAAAARAPARNDNTAFFFPGVESLEPAVRRAAAHPRPYGYYHQPAPARNDGAFFSDVESPEPAVRSAVLRPRPTTRSSRSVSVPVRFVGAEESELEPEQETAGLRVSAEEAAVRVQAAARGFLARRMVREVRDVEREAEGVAARVAAEAEALRGDARGRVAVGEALMRLLLRLDAVRGVREYRRRVTKRVLALQDAVDALEVKAAPDTAPVTDAPAAADGLVAETVEMAEDQGAEESEMAPELPHAPEHGAEIGAETAAESLATETAAKMEVDGGRAIGDETDHVKAEQVVDDDKAEAAEGEWEMVREEEAVAGQNPAPKAGQQEPAGEEKEKKTYGGGAHGLDAKKVMDMVAALCERSAQQCAVIGALAERVDALERAVRRVEEADRRRRRSKKLKKEGKGNSKAARSCYSD